jgi:hypothetical protein
MGGKISAISTISLENSSENYENCTETTFHNTDDSSNGLLQGDTSGTSVTNENEKGEQN